MTRYSFNLFLDVHFSIPAEHESYLNHRKIKKLFTFVLGKFLKFGKLFNLGDIPVTDEVMLTGSIPLQFR